MRKLIICAFLITLFAQQIFGQSDTSSNVLRLEDYLNLVLANHPVVRQADLVIAGAEAELLSAKGLFDPKLQSSYDVKNFKDYEYYDLFNATLKVPIWIPIDPKISFDRNQGEYLNPERTIPSSDNYQQISAGVSIPIGKGLFMDERRLVLKQARIYQDIAKAEQVKIINKTLLYAIKDYWNWFLTYQKATLLSQSRDIAQELYNRVVLDYGYGEAAVVDTIQAKITYQTRQADYEQAKFELINARLMLATHLWSPENIPLELQENTIPDTLANFGDIPPPDKVEEMISWATVNHPEVQKNQFKIQQLEIENQWYRESLKPQVDLSYSFINAPIAPGIEANSPSFSDNYKLGVDFSFPLFLRKERGKIQKTDLKIESQVYQQNQIKLGIKNNILSKVAETQMSNSLSDQFREMSENYNRLLQAEFLNLETGESDLFKLNIQQDKYIGSQVKYLEYLVKFQKNKAEILYEGGYPGLGLLP